MRARSLKFKVTLFVTVGLSAAMVAFTLAVVQNQRTALLDEAAAHVTRLSEVVKQSTRFAMLQNQPAYVDQIIQDVANLESIARVRILNKEGRIIHSTNALERGQTVDRKAEGCFLCHQGEKPLAQVNPEVAVKKVASIE